MRKYSRDYHGTECQWVFGFGHVWFSSAGQLWQITRTTEPAGKWIARDDAGKHPPIYAFTLKAMSIKLSQLEDQPNA